VLRGSRVVRTFRASTRRARTLHRLRFDAERRPRGDYRFRIIATAGRTTVRPVLTTRRL
jgi:hypothetical protein